jgi:hypothetical protein
VRLQNVMANHTQVGNYKYAPQHPMKPQRIRMAHDLIMRYGLWDKMEIMVHFLEGGSFVSDRTMQQPMKCRNFMQQITLNSSGL